MFIFQKQCVPAVPLIVPVPKFNNCLYNIRIFIGEYLWN